MNSIIYIYVNITRSMMALDLKNLVFLINESKKLFLPSIFLFQLQYVPVFSNCFFFIADDGPVRRSQEQGHLCTTDRLSQQL